MTETPQQDRIDTEHLRDYSELRRSTTDRKVAGVAGGLGRHLNLDPTILRVAFVVLAFFGGAGLLLYGALWLFVPEEGSDEAVVHTSPSTRTALLVAAAVVAAFLLVGDSWGGFGFPWPLLLVAVVLAVVLMNRDKPMNTTYPPPPPPGTPGPHPGDREEAEAVEETSVTDAPAPWSGTVPPAPASYTVPVPPPPRRDRGPRLFWFTVALLSVALGTLGLYDVAVDGVSDGAYAALALAVVGGMLVVGAWFGRPGGLILLGVVASLALLSTSIAEPGFDDSRRQVFSPTSAVQVEDRYFVPAGAVSLDLSNIRDVERLDGRTVAVSANAGELVVTLPEGVDVDVEADVAAAGEVSILGRSRGGFDVTEQQTIDGGEDVPELTLDLDLVVGSIQVRQ